MEDEGGEADNVAIGVENGALVQDDDEAMSEVVRREAALDPVWRVVFETPGTPWEDLDVSTVIVGLV